MIECFFFVDRENENDGDGTIRALCVSCRMKLPKEFPAWFYSGQVGPWSVTCYNCGNVIHLHEEQHEAGSQKA